MWIFSNIAKNKIKTRLPLQFSHRSLPHLLRNTRFSPTFFNRANVFSGGTKYAKHKNPEFITQSICVTSHKRTRLYHIWVSCETFVSAVFSTPITFRPVNKHNVKCASFTTDLETYFCLHLALLALWWANIIIRQN